jgi:transcriptional regulator with XRE-family HTH domain
MTTHLEHPPHPHMLVKPFTTHSAIFGVVLKLIREHKKIKQKAVSTYTHMSISSISKIEKGEYTINLEFLCKASVLYNISISKMFELFENIILFVNQHGIEIKEDSVEFRESKMDDSGIMIMPMFGKMLWQYVKNSKACQHIVNDFYKHIS